ncbi:MAG: XTP/dITP diphosphatase [Deltaproteobacteria bacterium]|nr:MAG: XTP/dITP diphosphatase [Deltaproteobacteria bacterium]
MEAKGQEEKRIEIVVATRNRGKMREIEEIVAGFPLRLRSLREFPDLPPLEESAPTFEGNALLKARAVSSHSGLPALADDSGLCVDALKGAPGVHSARYAGPDASDETRIAKLLAELGPLPLEERGATFVCVMALVFPEREPLIVEGRCRGVIAFAPAGTGGFGYDPIFVPEGFSRSFAELSPEVKNRVSHRARALNLLKQRLSTYLPSHP